MKEYMIKGFAMDDERLKQGKTAAEIVYNQADHTKENMGLTTWKNAPDGRILKSDTPIAKNYLDEKQIRQLERAVTGYFDYIEDLIERENVFTMEEFSKSVNEFLAFRRYDILKDNGRISHKQAVEKAYQEYDIFNKTQPIESDFDKIVKVLDYVIMIQLRKIVFYESDQSNFLCKGELYEKDISDRRNNFCK